MCFCCQEGNHDGGDTDLLEFSNKNNKFLDVHRIKSLHALCLWGMSDIFALEMSKNVATLGAKVPRITTFLLISRANKS